MSHYEVELKEAARQGRVLGMQDAVIMILDQALATNDMTEKRCLRRVSKLIKAVSVSRAQQCGLDVE